MGACRKRWRMELMRVTLPQLIASVPHVIDSEPREAVVAMGLNSAGLPTVALLIDRTVLIDESSGPGTAAAIAEELAACGGDVAVLVSYTSEHIRDGCAALERLRLEVEFTVPAVELAAVVDGRWFRPGCHNPECCPEEGRELPAVPEGLPRLFAAAREQWRRADNALHERVRARFEAAEEWDEALRHGAVTDAATARRLAAALDDLFLRDWVVLTILGADDCAAEDALEGVGSEAIAHALDAAMYGDAVPEPLSVERSRAVIERVARAARGRRRQAAVHTLAAVLDWWEGNLSDAFERSQRALEHDRDYRLAELVNVAAARGIGPGWLGTAGQRANRAPN